MLNTIWVALATYFADYVPDDGWTRMGRGMLTTFAEDWRDEASAKAVYLAHNQLVRDTAPKDRFLEWRPEDGWEPICRGLGLAVPDDPFPHTNTTAQARAEIGSSPPRPGTRTIGAGLSPPAVAAPGGARAPARSPA